MSFEMLQVSVDWWIGLEEEIVSYQSIGRKVLSIKITYWQFIMFIVGLTGGIATGKSTVSEIFREHGIPVIDADVAARKGIQV